MAKPKTTAKATKRSAELDGVYVLKLLLYVLLGSLWLKVSNGDSVSIGLPVGFMVGLVFASHEHFRIDRKIEHATLLVAMLVGYFLPYGLFLSL